MPRSRGPRRSTREINAIIHDLSDAGREQAAGELPDGPFKGVPFLLKDLGAANAGEPLHLGMKLLKDADFTLPGGHHPGPALPRRRPRSPSVRRTRPSSGSSRRPSRRPTGRRATPGTPPLRRRLERRLGRRRGRGDRPDGPCQRRRRFDPHPGLQQRPRRPEDDPAADQRGTDDRRRHVRRDGRALRLANGPRHRARCSRRSTAPLPATPTSRRRRCGPTSRSSTTRAAGCGSGVIDRPRSRASRSRRRAWRRSRRRAKLIESLGHEVDEASIADLMPDGRRRSRHRGHLHDPLGGRPGGDADPARDADRTRRSPRTTWSR